MKIFGGILVIAFWISASKNKLVGSNISLELFEYSVIIEQVHKNYLLISHSSVLRKSHSVILNNMSS